MAYRSNPFFERMSERTTSDQDFVRLFSPKILERIPDDAFDGAVNVFRSPPGGGKTTLLRAFTPSSLKAFWNTRKLPEMNESYQRLAARNLLNEEGPQLLGVYLSCASGYADLPPGATFKEEGLFRALLDCRVVLRTLRSLASFLGFASVDQLADIKVEYDEPALDIKSIPLASTVIELIQWAEQHERKVYSQLDAIETSPQSSETPAHVRFESVLWLQGAKFIKDGKTIAPQRLLMIDDSHKLRRKQRSLLIEELTELRPKIPVWLAERNIALGSELLSQGAREGRDIKQYDLEEMWNSGRGFQFLNYALNILERRLAAQDLIPKGHFAQYMRSEFAPVETRASVEQGILKFQNQTLRHQSNAQYSKWLDTANVYINEASIDSLRELYSILILIERNEGKRQLTLELMPLSPEELEDRDSSQVQAAAEIFIHEDLKVPYYFGIERLCAMATNNVEELLGLAAVLYDGIQDKQVLRRPDLILSPQEQEKLLKDAAKRKREFIPKSHTEGSRAQKLLDAIGMFCREKTFQFNAPYAPGVTGIRLSFSELEKLHKLNGPQAESLGVLKKVVSECVAENLLVTRPSQASTSRDGGLVFYLNRTLCVNYGLPLQMGGWQDIKVEEMVDWMQLGRTLTRKKLLETN